MTIINITEDSNNPAKYLFISRSDGTTETLVTTNVAVTTSNRISVIEVSKLKGDKGDAGERGPPGPPGANGVIFDILPVNSGGTNNATFDNNKIIYFDGSKLASSNIDVDNVATDVISNILTGGGLSRVQDGNTVTVNANLGNGVTLDSFNRITLDNNVITTANFNLASGYVKGTLDIPYGGTNNTFFGSNKLIYYDGSKLASLPLETGNIVFSGLTIDIVAGPGLTGGGPITIPNGSLVIGLQDSSDIIVYEDSIELSSIVSSGIYSKVTVDNKGRVTNGSQITFQDIISYLGFTPWYAGNDGEGSGLDADLLDGQQGSYYRNAANTTGILSTEVLPDIIQAGTAPRVSFNAKGLIIDSGILRYLDITDGLGYIPFDKGGGQILGDVELLGNLFANSGSFDSYTIDIGPNDSTLIGRGIKFNYGDSPQKTATLAYYPQLNVFKIIAEGSQSGTLLTEEKGDTKYITIVGEQTISGIKTFLENVNIYGQLVMRTKYAGLPVFDIGSNNLLVSNLNADYLDNQHGNYYRNATNLTGTLNSLVVIPHIEDRATVDYSVNDFGGDGIEYLPRFHKPSQDHPMVLQDSIIYQTGLGIYVEDGNLSVGYKNLINDSSYSAFIGSSNSGDSQGINSLAVGQNNQVLSQNSLALNENSKTFQKNTIALGNYGEAWIEDQIAIGGFETIKTGSASVSFRDAHGQISYIPLKYHGIAGDSFRVIKSFDIPTNKTIEYSAELLFTKQKGSGSASFVSTTGIIKNFAYRIPEESYAAKKKMVVAIDNPDIVVNGSVANHKFNTLYNNSQERIYNLSITAALNGIETNETTTFEVTASPHQYESLDIQSQADPIIVKPMSDHSVKLYATKGYTGYSPLPGFYNPYSTAYRSGHLIRLSPFEQYPYNTGSPVNLGENIHNITECIYFRKFGEKETYIKFHNHGIHPDCPLEQTVSVGSGDNLLNIYKDSNFNFYIPKISENSILKQSIISPIGGSGYRVYLPKNIIGGISGTGSFHIYQTTGLSPNNYSVPSIDDEFYADSNNWKSEFYDICQFYFEAKNLHPTEKNWSNLENRKITLSITNKTGPWNSLGNLNINGYIIPELGCITFNLNKTPPLTGPLIGNIQPQYYIDDLSFSGIFNPFVFIKCIDDNFKYVDQNTLSFTEKQLGFINNDELRLVSYPHQFDKRLGFDHDISNQHFDLKINDVISIDDTLTFVTQIKNAENSKEKIYKLHHNFNTSDIFDVFLANSISGVGFSDYRSFVSYTGTYSFEENENPYYSVKTNLPRKNLPLVIKDSEEIPNTTVPTGTGFIFTLPGPLTDSNQGFNITGINILSNYNTVCVSSVIIEANNSNNFELPNLQYLDLAPTDNVYVSGLYAKYLDFRVNNVKIFGDGNNTIPIIYPEYSGPLSLKHHIVPTDPPTVFVSGGLNIGDNISYKYLTSNNSNSEHILSNSLTVDPLYPSFGESNMKLIRFSDWFLSNTLWNGSVHNTGVDLKFDFYPQNIRSLDNTFISNSGSFYSGVIATGSVSFSKRNLTDWNATDIDFGESTCEIIAVQNYNYSDYGKILTTGYIETGVALENKLMNTKIYEVFNINILSPTNTGVFGLTINGNKPYQTLTVNFPESNNELLRILNDPDSDKLDNRLNISFNIDNYLSGIFNPSNFSNKFFNDNPNLKQIETQFGDTQSFTVGVQSGIFPNELPHNGSIVLNHSKIYNLFPRSFDTKNRDRNNIFSFLTNRYLQSGIYDVIDLNGKDIYIYDFANSFDNITTYDTGILHSNYTAYNVTDSKFSLWGRDFNGNIISYPIRDRSAFFSDFNLSCASGYACVKISGVPTYLNVGDKFYIDFDIGIYPQSSDLIPCSGYFVPNQPMILAESPENSGLVVGMNVFGNFISSTAYISGFIPYAGQTAIVLRNQANFSEFVPTSQQLFTFNKETNTQRLETTNLKNTLQSLLSGPHTVQNIIKPGVISITPNRPRFFDDSSQPLYNYWNNTVQETRGITLWRNSGATGIAVMITGNENIQTDRNPNYNNRFMSISNNINLGTIGNSTEEVLLYKTNGLPTGNLNLTNYSNLNHHNGFNIVLNKYLSDCAFSGIYKPFKGSGTISSSVYWPNSSDWTINPAQTTTQDTNLLIRDIDNFQIVSANYKLSEQTFALNPTGISGYYYISGVPQNSGISILFGLVGGLGLEQVPPKISLGLIDSGYNLTTTYISGITDQLSNSSYVFGPTSNSWLVDLSLSGLNNMDYFDLEFNDFIDGKIRTRIYNIDPTGSLPFVSNFTNSVFYNQEVPWVVSFDVENVSSNVPIGISTENTSDLTFTSSGLFYTNQLNKWQGFIVGNSTNTDTSYNISFAITGGISPIVYNDLLTLNSTNDVYTTRITNLPTGIVRVNDDTSITGYFNFQKPRFESSNIQISFSKPSNINIVSSKINTLYTDITNRELYEIIIENTGLSSYNLGVNIQYPGDSTIYNDSTKIIVAQNLSIVDLYVPFQEKLVGENWIMFFDVIGGNPDGSPDIKLFNSPSDYGYEITQNDSINGWSVLVTGNQDIFGRYGQSTGVYNINISARDFTSFDNTQTSISYLCPVKIENVRPYYAVKNKSYFANIDLANCEKEFTNNFNPSINSFLPSTQTKIYDKYNPLINKYEVRYSGQPLLNKWDADIYITNLNTESDYDDDPFNYGYFIGGGNNNFNVRVKGLDTDLISVVGILRLKELYTFSTDYPPLTIVSVEPDSEDELNQGEDWKLGFKVVGGLANELYPPTIIISGFPTLNPEQKSACSGYYPDENIQGLSCMSKRNFVEGSDAGWEFEFTGVSFCRTGIFPIAIKAFDTTGEDTHDTSYIFKPLSIPGPSIAPKEIEYNLYPNCQYHSGSFEYKSSSRGNPCPYATGINTDLGLGGVEIILGQLPAGLTLFNNGGLDENGLGTGRVSIVGTPTEFPANNIYPPFTLQVTDKAGKTARVNVTYNTSSIAPMDTNPVGGLLYFPGSGYYEPITMDGEEKTNEVKDFSQRMFYPYPSTGLFYCSSSLVDNNCPIQITGYYTKLYNSGLQINFGYEQGSIQNSHVFAVFELPSSQFSNSKNGIYQLVKTGSSYVNLDTGWNVINYTGILTQHGNDNIFDNISPTEGQINIVKFDVSNKELISSLVLEAEPTPTINGDNCILGSGVLTPKKDNSGNTTGYVLQGKFRPSLIANINDTNEYPEPSTNVTFPGFGELPELFILKNLDFSVIPSFGGPEIHEFSFSNCYETGVTYLSGIILPMPSIEITDPGTVFPQSHNTQSISFGTRCAFTENYRSFSVNQREVSVKYYIKSLETNEYIQKEGNPPTFSLGANYTEYEHDTTDPITITNLPTPSINSSLSGCIYHLHMWRDSDVFPTFDPKSYDYMEYDLYWIHDSRTYIGNPPAPNTNINDRTFPATKPVYFGSGITVMSGVPFFISGELIGGRTDGLSNNPTLTNLFVESSDLNTEILDGNNNAHRIALYQGQNLRNGAWRCSITGIIENLLDSTSYLNDFILKTTIEENYAQDQLYEKTYTSLIPVTILKPLELNIVPVEKVKSVNYGNKWTLQFYISGGNRPPVYFEDISYWIENNIPIIEINGGICLFVISSKAYNINTNTWTINLESTNILIESATYNLSVRDNTGYVSDTFTRNIGS